MSQSFAHSYDAVVVGAGPAGTAAAAGFARRGARVLLLEANPNASKRFAGELIHPTGARILEELEIAPHDAIAAHDPTVGFAVFPDDGSAPIALEYEGEHYGFSCEHSHIVGELRERAQVHTSLTYVERARVTSVEGKRVRFTHEGREHEVLAERIGAADGRSSVVRKSLRPHEEAELISHMAGVELRGVELPFEGYGHVFLGGPGPILLYRIGPDQIRACLDLPANAPGALRDARYLWDAFGPRFPEALRPAFRDALESQRLAWASNRFLPRTFYGEGPVALIGDAVGFYHPLTASGITVALKDTKALLEAPTLDAYRLGREPRSYVPELLGNALYQVFVREDESAAAIRTAVFDMWRSHPEERARTMRLLAGDEIRMDQFGAAFVRVALRALRTVASERPRIIRRFGEWSQWPAATMVPTPVRRRIRIKSSATQPLKGLRFAPKAQELPEVDTTKKAIEIDVDAILSRVREEDLRTHSPMQKRAAELRTAVAELDPARAQRAIRALVQGRADTLSGTRDTALALKASLERFPGLLAATIEAARDRLRNELLERQTEDGSFGSLHETAEALESLHALGLPIFHPALRRAFRVLAASQRSDGSFGDAWTTAIVARALLETGAPLYAAAEKAIESLGREDSLHLEAGEALRAYRDRRATRILPNKERRRRGQAAQHDLEYCHQALLAVSRSFARPIEMLPGDLRTAVTCGYLLCRIADTIEDNEHFTVIERDARYATFLEALHADPGAEVMRTFERQFQGIECNEVERDLCAHLSVVMRVFRTLPEGMQVKTSRWVAEMTRGMQIYSHRAPAEDGFIAVHTVEDLERYCFFVAGTVGHMLTDLFSEAIGVVGQPTEHALREQAEAFGIGLQLVNILKDVTDDRERKVSYVPRVSCAKHGIGIDELVDPKHRDTAHAIVAPLFDAAQARLDRALEYVLAIPADQMAIRLFCLLPLWMAVRTLVHGRGNDAMFTAGAPVKISRTEVEALIADCMSSAGNDEQLRARYDALWRAPTTETSIPQQRLH